MICLSTMRVLSMADDAILEGLLRQYREQAETMTYLKRAKLLLEIWGSWGATAQLRRLAR